MKRRLKALADNTNFVSVINENNILIFMVFAFLLGNLISVLLFKLKNDSGSFYKAEFESFISSFSGGFWKIFFASILEVLPFVSLVFLAGTSMAGSILTPLIIALRGVILGFLASYLYIHYSLNGIVFNMLIIIPSAVLTSLSLILSGREAFGFSLSLARLAFPGAKTVVLENDFKLYCIRQLFIFLFFLVGALLKTVMAVSFFSFFKF